MNRDFLTRLYWACTDEMAGDALTELGGLYERLENSEKVMRGFNEQLAAANLPKEDKNRLEKLNVSAITVYEQQGFINGFRLGMQLARELEGSACE